MSSELNNPMNRLAQMNEKIQAIEQGGGILEFHKPELGLVARLNPSRLQLTLNDGRRMQVVSLDLSDPANSKFLEELARGFDSGLALRSIEEAVVRSGCLVRAMAQPFFEHMGYGASKNVQIRAGVDDNAEVKTLQAQIGSTDNPVSITEEKALRNLTSVIEQQFGREKLGIELKATTMGWHGIKEEQQKMKFFEWFMQPLPAPKPGFRPGMVAAGDEEIIKILDEIAKLPLRDWKDQLWKRLGSKELDGVRIGVPTDATPEVCGQRAQLQALLDEMNAQPWRQGSP